MTPFLTVTLSPRFEYLFNFDNTFEIHDDIEVLKRMGMACGLESGSCSAEDLKMARSLVPKALEPYVTGPLCPVPLVAAGPDPTLDVWPAFAEADSALGSRTGGRPGGWGRPGVAGRVPVGTVEHGGHDGILWVCRRSLCDEGVKLGFHLPGSSRERLEFSEGVAAPPRQVGGLHGRVTQKRLRGGCVRLLLMRG